MTATAFALVTASAMLHVFWNAAVRHADGSRRFVWLLTWGAGLAGLLASGASLGAPGLWHAWPWLSASIALNALYFLALARTYADGELSWAYPLSRGVAVAVSAPLALLLFDQRMGPATWAGLGLVVGGLGLLEGRAATAVRRGDGAAPLGAGTAGIAAVSGNVRARGGVGRPDDAWTPGAAVEPADAAVRGGIGARAGGGTPGEAGVPAGAAVREDVRPSGGTVAPGDAGAHEGVAVPAGVGLRGETVVPGCLVAPGAVPAERPESRGVTARGAATVPGGQDVSDGAGAPGETATPGGGRAPGGAGRHRTPSLVWPVCVGLLVAGYSLVDSQGVRSAPPLPYAALEYLGSALLITPAMRGAPRVARPAVPLAAGALSLVSYVCMLYAYRLAPVAPALAVRQIAPALAPLAGALLLRERITRRRAWGTAAIVAGAALMAVGR